MGSEIVDFAFVARYALPTQDAIEGKKPYNKDISWEHRVSIATDIASGINYLHERRIIHRE